MLRCGTCEHYLIPSLVAAISFNVLTSNREHRVIATLFPLLAAPIAQHIFKIRDGNGAHLHLPYCIAMSVSSYPLGFAARGIHQNVFDIPKQASALQIVALHTSLALICNSDIESNRLRFISGDRQVFLNEATVIIFCICGAG
jgi:hypothetical protein